MHTPALVEFQKRSDKYREQLNRSGVPLDLAGEVARILAAATLSSAPLRSPQQRRLIQQANLYLSPNARAGLTTSLVDDLIATIHDPSLEMENLQSNPTPEVFVSEEINPMTLPALSNAPGSDGYHVS